MAAVAAVTFDVAVVGGGIVGLSTAMEIGRRRPGATIVLIEKEQRWAAHQSGHNSGVIHSGIYYRPGSFKARFCREGNRSMVAFCQQHDIPHEICGKVIVATDASELPQLEALHQRGLDNGLEVRRLTPEEVTEVEPHVRSVGGLQVPSTGIVDYPAVCRAYARIIEAQGGDLRLGTTVVGIRRSAAGYVLETDAGDLEAGFVVNCAGLHSDRVARLAGADPQAQIVPFRGEYFELTPGRRHLVRSLVYPVPNPDFPFLGVHFTKMIDGSVHAGPNAVPGLKREGYRKRDVSGRDVLETLRFPGFWRMARANHGEGRKEIARSLSKAAFVRSLQRLIPEVTAEDIVPTHAGVRAQALLRSGQLVDDFLLVHDRQAVHVCNAPSPAATASLEIGRAVADALPDLPSSATMQGVVPS